MGSPVLEVVWSRGQGSLSVVTDDTISVLSERIMHHATCGALFILQQSNTSVCVIYNKNNISTLPKTNDESKHNSNSNYDSKYNDTISSDHQSWLINTDMLIKGVACSKTAFILWNGKSVLIYRVLPAANRIEQMYTMHTTSTAMVIADTTDIIEDSIFICDDYNIKIYNFNGAIRGNIAFSEVEGKPITIDINGKYLAVITNKGYMKLYDIYTPTKAKALGNGTKFYSPYNNMEIGSPTTGASPRPTATPAGSSLTPTDRYTSTTGAGGGSGGGVGGGSKVVVEEEYNENICMSVDSIKVNCDGTRIAVLVSTEEGILRIRHPHSCIYIYDRLKGSILYHNFAQDTEAGEAGGAKGGGGACPRSIVFDDTDDRILTCEVEYTQGTSTTTSTTKPLPSDGTTSLAKAFSTTDKDPDDTKLTTTTSPTSPNSNNNNSTTTIYQFFISTEHGILLQDSFTEHSTYGNLIGVSVPHIYFKTTTDISTNNSNNNNNTHNMHDNSSTVYDINALKETSAGFQEVISNKVICILMRDFINMGIVDSATKLALLDFSYNLTLGMHMLYMVLRSIIFV